MVGGATVSVTMAYLIGNLQVGDEEWHAKLVAQGAVELHDCTEPPERAGWRLMIERARRSALVGSAAVIVDSELDGLSGMNEGGELFADGWCLPQGYTLVYASADRGTVEFVGSAALARCDRVATRLLEGVARRRDVSDGMQPSGVRWCTRCRDIPAESAEMARAEATRGS